MTLQRAYGSGVPGFSSDASIPGSAFKLCGAVFSPGAPACSVAAPFRRRGVERSWVEISGYRTKFQMSELSWALQRTLRCGWQVGAGCETRSRRVNRRASTFRAELDALSCTAPQQGLHPQAFPGWPSMPSTEPVAVQKQQSPALQSRLSQPVQEIQLHLTFPPTSTPTFTPRQSP